MIWCVTFCFFWIFNSTNIFYKIFTYLYIVFFKEFSGVVGSTESMELESDMKRVPGQTLEILASCHALVFVDNKLVCWYLIISFDYFIKLYIFFCVMLQCFHPSFFRLEILLRKLHSKELTGPTNLMRRPCLKSKRLNAYK